MPPQAHVNHGDDSLSVVTVRPIRAGDEVLNYYGPHPNSELLRRYGYVTPLHARHDVVELPWSDVEDALRAEVGVSPDALARVRAALEDDAEFEDTFVLEREPADVGPDGTFGGAAPAPVALPEDLLEQLKTVVKALGKLDAAAAGAVASDKRKRRQTIEAVVARVLVAVEARYTTTAAEDERLLAQGGDLPLRKRMAIVVRLGEKKLLQEAKAQLAANADARDDAPEEGSGKRARRA